MLFTVHFAFFSIRFYSKRASAYFFSTLKWLKSDFTDIYFEKQVLLGRFGTHFGLLYIPVPEKQVAAPQISINHY
jgi:hypothetical protein